MVNGPMRPSPRYSPLLSTAKDQASPEISPGADPGASSARRRLAALRNRENRPMGTRTAMSSTVPSRSGTTREDGVP